MPAPTRSAAVLIGLVDRAEGLQVLLTQRAAELSNHAGQISFPGGRIEPEDNDAWAAACRETQEEIGVAPELLQRLGYLPDHSVVSGYRVTPVVALVQPHYQLRLDQREVAEAFEVPLRHFLDPRQHQVRERHNGNRHYRVSAMPYANREIWGATAGILLTMFNLLDRGVSR
jgi:8-oxo-dGTP pyrophosphatase MutT (NUDIX family)